VDDNGDRSQVEIMIRETPALALAIIDHIQKREPVLIHCSAGRQRSAALAAIVLMNLRNISAEEAMSIIRVARPEAFFPQANFAAAITAVGSASLSLIS
jgi:protein-tyrosine phosphatase